MKLAKPVVDNITKAMHWTLDDFSNAASKRMDSEIDIQSGKEVADVNITNKSYMVKGNTKTVIHLLGPL